MEAIKSYEGIGYLEQLALWNGRSEFKLDSLRSVLGSLGNPQEKFASIIVGGTNGKGSVSAAIAAILGAEGHKVGLNTSPHLRAINERIVIDGLPLSSDELSSLALSVRKAVLRVGTNLSFHEAITAVAYLAFAENRCDWGVMEVGVGVLDAANIVKDPLVSVLVSVNFDHQHLLGETLAKIAREKGAIMRRGRPFVLGDLPPEALSVVKELSLESGSKLVSFRTDFSYERRGEKTYFKSRDKNFRFMSVLPGEHQLHNMSVAIQSALSVGCSENSCVEGTQQMNWPGRLEWCVYEGRRFLFDSAHNPAGFKTLLKYIQGERPGKTNLIFGAIETKDWREMIKIIEPAVSEWWVVEPSSEQAVSAAEVQTYLSSIGITSRAFGVDYRGLVEKIGADNSKDSIYVVAGSIYMMAAVRAILVAKEAPLWRSKLN